MAQSPNIRSLSSSSASFTNIITLTSTIMIIIIAQTIGATTTTTTTTTTVEPTTILPDTVDTTSTTPQDSTTPTATISTPVFDIEQYTTNLTNHLLPDGYNKNIRPHVNEQLVVNVGLHIIDISPVSETSMEFKIDLILGQDWNDDRLSFPYKNDIYFVTLGQDFMKKIWMPDTNFYDVKNVKFHKTVSDESLNGLRVTDNGDVIFGAQLTLTIQCSMDLAFFPMDQQKCSIKITTFAHFIRDINYKWLEYEPLILNPSIQSIMPTFHLLGFKTREHNYTVRLETFKMLQCDFYLARSIGYYISQIYIPALLIVVISWVPFWLDQNDHHARVALGVTTVLTMTTLVTNSEFPKSSHLKAIDIYLFVCFIMVFLSLLEYATVGYFERIQKTYREKQRQQAQEEAKTQQNPQDTTAAGGGGGGGGGGKDISNVLIPMEKLSKEEDDDDDDDGNNNNYNKNVVNRKRLKHNNVRFVEHCKDDQDGQDGASRRRRRRRRRSSSGINPRLITNFIIIIINDVSLIDKWARRIFPLVFWLFNLFYVIILLYLVRTYQKVPEIEIKVPQ